MTGCLPGREGSTTGDAGKTKSAASVQRMWRQVRPAPEDREAAEDVWRRVPEEATRASGQEASEPGARCFPSGGARAASEVPENEDGERTGAVDVTRRLAVGSRGKD